MNLQKIAGWSTVAVLALLQVAGSSINIEPSWSWVAPLIVVGLAAPFVVFKIIDG